MGRRFPCSTARSFAWLGLFAAACGSAPAPDPASLGGAHERRAAAREGLLFGLEADALPELASIWPALSAHAATEVTESLHVEERAHCVRIEVVGDLAHDALRAWRLGARAASFACTHEDTTGRCEGEGVSLVAGPVAASGEAPLEALATEIGIVDPPGAAALACVHDVGAQRLARIDERLHRAGLLEPWRDLHDRLGLHRFASLSWTRSAEGDDLSVRYGPDEEALEIAAEWAREAGLSDVGGVWHRREGGLVVALEVRTESLVLGLTREP